MVISVDGDAGVWVAEWLWWQVDVVVTKQKEIGGREGDEENQGVEMEGDVEHLERKSCSSRRGRK